MLQLILDFEYDDTHLELVPTLNLMCEGSGLRYNVLLWPGEKRRWALVQFKTRRQREMDNLLNELVLCYEDQDTARKTLTAKITGREG